MHQRITGLFLGTMLVLCAAFTTVFAQVQGGNGGGFGGSNGGGFGGGNRPSNGRVVLYTGIKYTGQSRSFGVGNFTARQLGFGVIGKISSVQIPRGWYVDIADNRGRRYRLTASQTALSSIGWDNRIVSGVIGVLNGSGNGDGFQGGNNGGGGNQPIVVTLHYDLNMTGRAVNFATGSFPSVGVNVDRNITSITVAPGYAVRVYSQTALRGRSQIFGQSVNDLRRYGWDNQVASIVVYAVGQGRPPGFGSN
ncbi:hypothetical protein [Spirosoma sordidisoli]|uniref:Uncharacterized protein n=1 Tax=Spirosoma sordidisoli TaxID=2502893 RepID=A0A4Q2UEY7_9BACT|nr:hypothetical protein [Spirosoma sordidisoli]RYC67833.1 hypothetical protein EQG79_20415 [Spirosoma sordidisoli]